MQFKVPQFLEIEDKIFGPFTFRQFVYLAGGAGICFMLYKLVGFVIAAIPILLIAGFALLLTFYRPNNKPFIEMVEAGLKYFTQNKLYIWQKQVSEANREKMRAVEANKKTAEAVKNFDPKLTESKLRDLAWSLDVLDLSKKREIMK